MNNYVGIIYFENPISCLKEVSGKQFRSKIAETDLLIIFPSIPTDYDGSQVDLQNGELVMPHNLFKGKVNWGTINNYPQCLFSVNAVLCYFLSTEIDVNNIYGAFPRWKEKIKRLHIIKTGDYIHPQQIMPAIVRGGGFDDGLRIFRVDENEKSKTLKYAVNSRTTEAIRLHFVETKEAFSFDGINNLFTNAGSSKQIALAYELLFTAYCAMERNDFRSAVILGGSAVEKAVLERMKKEYSNSSDYEKAKDKHWMLGGKFRWLSEKNISIPVADYKTSILDLRNDTTHDGICPSYSATKECLEKCKILIEEFHPNVLEQ